VSIIAASTPAATHSTMTGSALPMTSTPTDYDNDYYHSTPTQCYPLEESNPWIMVPAQHPINLDMSLMVLAYLQMPSKAAQSLHSNDDCSS